MLLAYEVAAAIHERSAGVWQAVLAAASGDAEVDRWRREVEEGRRTDVGRAVERILDRPIDGELLTALWLLLGPEVYVKLDGAWKLASLSFTRLMTPQGPGEPPARR